MFKPLGFIYIMLPRVTLY